MQEAKHYYYYYYLLFCCLDVPLPFVGDDVMYSRLRVWLFSTNQNSNVFVSAGDIALVSYKIVSSHSSVSCCDKFFSTYQLLMLAMYYVCRYIMEVD